MKPRKPSYATLESQHAKTSRQLTVCQLAVSCIMNDNIACERLTTLLLNSRTAVAG